MAHGFLEQPAFSITPGSLHRIGRNGEGIREWAQRAGKEIEQEIIWKLAQEILDEILTPALHKASVIARINQYSPGVSATAVRALGQRSLEDIAGSDAGPQILNTLLLKLAGTPEATAVAKALDARSSSKTAIPVAPASPESITALERMNRVLGSDPRFGEYARADIPLKFPVQLYSAGRAVDGGVYYDPNLESTGLVPIKGTRAGVGGQISRLQYPLLFIKLGPPALASSDAYLQSTLWHEFSHYRRALEFRKPDKDKSEAVKLLEAAVGPEGEGQDPDNETEATSIQLADYHASLTDEDVKSTLLYLARFIKKANAPFKPDAIKRIRDAVAGTPAQRLRLIRLIDGLKNTERRNNLSDLRSALAK